LEISLLEERTNPLLHRKEYRFAVAHGTEATPSRDNVRTELAKTIHVPKDRLVIERMNARFGTARTEGVAAAYDSAEALKAVVRDHIQVRNGFKAKEVKGPTAPSETAPPPAPTADKAPPEKALPEAPKEKAAEKVTEKPSEKPPEKGPEKNAGKTPEKHPEKGSEKRSEKGAEKSPEKHPAKGGEKPARKAGDKPHETPAPKGA